MKFPSRFGFALSLYAALALLPVYGLAAGGATKAGENWVGSWACSPQLVEPQNMPPSPGLAGNTLRQVVHVTLGGKQLRLRLSNEFGKTPMVITAVHVALPVGAGSPGAIKPESDQAVTFGGKASIEIPGGALMFSDPVQFTVTALSDLVITARFESLPMGLTGHPGSRQTSFIGAGDQLLAASLTSPVTAEHWYVFDGVDVVGPARAAALVALGDSITDGRGSITNQNTRWPDNVARNLSADKKLTPISVLNHGIGGNTILRGGLGPDALSRFDRDVIAQIGVRWVIVLEGVNDIGGTKGLTDKGGTTTVADDIIFAYRQLILRAHAHGIKIYGATITPFGKSFYDNASTAASREKVNEWIRTSREFDGLVDFDKALRDPSNPQVLDMSVDSGDHLHPNSEGYRRMAAAVDPGLFR